MGAGGKKSTWIAGTALVAVVMIVAAWFLAITPNMDRASATRAAAAQTRQDNDLLQLRVAQLAADFKKLDEYKAELQAAQTKIPTTAALSDYLRELDAAAVANGVTIITVTPGAPVAATIVAASGGSAAGGAATGAGTTTDGSTPAPSSTATDGTTTDGTTTDGTTTDGTTTDGTATAPQGPEGFVQIPMQVTVIGTFDGTQGFLDQIQQGPVRLFLVTSLAGRSLEDQSASAGRPATVAGDQELTITGQMYVLPDALSQSPGTDGTTDGVTPAPTPTLPPAEPGANPLFPIPGR